MSGIVYNGSTAGNIMINGVVPNVYYNGSKIWPNSTPVVGTQYKFRIEATTNNGLITCKFLQCNIAFPNEPYTYKDKYSVDSGYASHMIKGVDGGAYAWGDPENTWMECTFYVTGTLTNFRYTPMDSKPNPSWIDPSYIPDNMTEAKITLTNLTTNTVVLSRTRTYSYDRMYEYTIN